MLICTQMKETHATVMICPRIKVFGVVCMVSAYLALQRNIYNFAHDLNEGKLWRKKGYAS